MWKFLKVVLALVLLFLGFQLAERAIMLHWIHGWVQDRLGDFTGVDPTVTWLVAIAMFAIIRLVPLRSMLLAFAAGRSRALITIAAVSLAGAAALKVMDGRLLFGPDGKSPQSWVETADGPVILDASPGQIDRKTGLLRQTLTPEVLRSITLAKNHKENDGADAETNKYFSPRDGKYVTWFVEGSCETRDRDGYDDRGRKLQPATAEIVERCEKLRAETERLRQKDNETQARLEVLKQQKARRQQFQDIGRYVAIGRFITIDGIKYVFEECVVLRHQTRLKFRVVNSGSEGQTGGYGDSRFEFSLLNSDGTETRSGGMQRVQGMVTIASQDGILLPPSPGQSGWVVVEFLRDSESRGFAIAINHAVAFSNPAGHIVNFRKF